MCLETICGEDTQLPAVVIGMNAKWSEPQNAVYTEKVMAKTALVYMAFG